jgi:N-acetylmuramoyl-L-alanine amidase
VTIRGLAGGILLVAAATAALAQPVITPKPAPTSITQLIRDTSVPAANAPAAPARILPVVIDARVGEHPDRTRFVVEVSDPVSARVFTLANPNRVVVDMPEMLWRLQNAGKPTGKGVVKSYRYGLFRPGNSRIVIDLNGPVSASEPLILPPSDGHGYRMVLDLMPTTQSVFERTAGWPADLRAKENAAETVASIAPPIIAPPMPAAPVSNKKIIVIDAGHGGIDSGTMGVDGSMEKDLVLDEAIRLGRELQRRGYTVHLTRNKDVYIPLRERMNIGRGYDADLFISLHADSNPDASVEGMSVYTLSESGSDKEAAALARKENQSDIIAGVDLSGGNSPVASILIDLAQRDTMNHSSRFAETVVSRLSRTTDILPREPHRSAAFVVLKAPDVPAVLIELGYLSNAHDAAQMAMDGWRNGVAGAIADAVDRQFASAPPGPVAAKNNPE